MTQSINEDNIQEYIQKRINNNSLSEIFFEMKKEVDLIIKNKKVNQFISIEHNYTPIFLYYAIQKKCSLEEFAKILQISTNYEDGLNRYFGKVDCEYEEKNQSIYNQMKYLFFSKKNEKIIIDIEKIPYIKLLIENVREQNLLDFHSSRIDFFIVRILYNNQQLGKDILETIARTPTMKLKDEKNYPDMLGSVINIIAGDSYENNVSKIYELFKNNKDCNEILTNNLIEKKDKKYKTNLALYKMTSSNEDNHLEILIKCAKQLKNKLPIKEYYTLVEDILFSVESGMKDSPIKVSLDKIDNQLSLIENLPYLIALDTLIEQGNYQLIHSINEDVIEYITVYKKEIEQFETESERLTFDEYFSAQKVDWNKLEKFLNFQRMDNKFKTKTNNIKNKI